MGLVFGKAYKQYEDVGPDGKPIFVTEMADGEKNVLSGWEAKVALRHHKRPGYFSASNSPDVQDVLIKMNPDDARNGSIKYRLGKWLYDQAYNPYPSLVGRIMNKGALPAGALGAGAGLLGGAIADYAADKAGLDLPVSLKLIGMLGLGGLGAYLGYNRKQLREKYPNASSAITHIQDPSTSFILGSPSLSAPVIKSAALYNNPRNFILEKLQADTSLGFAEKAKLAAAVRNLDTESAEELKQQVRAQLGVETGTVVSNYIFNRNSAGSLFGGLLPILGGDLAKTLT